MVILLVEAVQTSEMLVNLYQSAQCYNPEDGRLRIHHFENLVSYFPFVV
jgi:hypothetical protein